MKKIAIYVYFVYLLFMLSGCSLSTVKIPSQDADTNHYNLSEKTDQKPPPSAHMVFEASDSISVIANPPSTANHQPSTINHPPSTIHHPLSLKKRTKERKTPWIPAPQVENIDISLK